MRVWTSIVVVTVRERVLARLLLVVDERDCGSVVASLGAALDRDDRLVRSLTRLTRYVPASTGVHGKSCTSQRGVVPIHCGGVLVVLASWRAACGLREWRSFVRRTLPHLAAFSYARAHHDQGPQIRLGVRAS